MFNLRYNGLRRTNLFIFIMLAVCLLTACGEKSVAATEDQFEASRMYDILHSRGLQVEKLPAEGEKAGWNIVINEGWFGEGEAAVATQILNDYGLPRAKETLPETSSPYGMTSPEEVQKRQSREKEIQIERQLYLLPGVIRVGVLIAQPDNDTLRALSGDKIPPTASVLIVQQEMPPRFSDTDVKNQVSGTVPDLKPDNIRITTTYQPLREIPLEELKAQRRSNKIYALGIGLIAVLAAALGVIWYALKRRKRASEPEQLTDESDVPELSTLKRPALEEGDEDY